MLQEEARIGYGNGSLVTLKTSSTILDNGQGPCPHFKGIQTQEGKKMSFSVTTLLLLLIATSKAKEERLWALSLINFVEEQPTQLQINSGTQFLSKELRNEVRLKEPTPSSVRRAKKQFRNKNNLKSQDRQNLVALKNNRSEP